MNSIKFRSSYVFIFLFLVIVVSISVISENLRLLMEMQEIAQMENPEERAHALAAQFPESKIIEKLITIYEQEKTCTPGELIGHLNFVNTFSLFTGVYVNAPENEAQAEQVLLESSKCIPTITKNIDKKSELIYSVSYLVLFPDGCSLPNKRIEVVIDTDVQNFTAKIVKGKLDPAVREGLASHVSTLDKFGNCSQEVIYKIAIDLGIADLPEEI